MSLALKKQINKEISNAGLAGSVEGAAIQRLAEAIQEYKRPELLQEVLSRCCQSGERGMLACLVQLSEKS